jgi:hypothetical protein
MKTAFLLALATVLTVASFAQTSLGLRAGVNFQNLNGKDFDGDNLDNKIKVGFNAGLTADIPVAGPDYYFQPGVLFTTKGAKAEGSDDKINISYIEVPLTFLYKPILGEGRLLLGIGPYVAFAVGGKAGDNDINFDSEVTDAQFETGSYYKRFDAGGNLLFGYEFTPKLSAQLNAQLGLAKINPKITNFNEGDLSVKNTGFGISLGYKIK